MNAFERGKGLPIYEIRGELEKALGGEGRVRVVVEAPTGSGKSTQVPGMVLDGGFAGDKEVVVLQPRRIAARMLAKRVAWERGGKIGGEVGYQVRFEKHVGRETRVRYVTEGILLREMLSDESLSGIGAIVFDEFHERHLYGDITLARAVELQETLRPDLKVVVMSATLETGALVKFLGDGCSVVRSEGRTFPVEVRYAPPKRGVDKTLPEQVVRACRDVLAGDDPGGDVLVFLPGAFEIRKTVDLLKSKGWTGDMDVLPLFGELPPAQQDLAVESRGRRKIVVATNVAETSLTIDGVRVVIDAGLARMAAFDVRRGINTLTVQKISQAASEQRAGRAGRTAPGVTVRLWSEREHAERRAQEVPEVQRMDLAEVALTLKACGVVELGAFRWFERPGVEALGLAERVLGLLGAVDKVSGEITGTGRMMTRFPLHPRQARVLIAGAGYGCLNEAALAIALSQGRGIFRRGLRGDQQGAKAFAAKSDTSDYVPQLRAWQYAEGKRFDGRDCAELGVNAGAAREAGALVRQLLGICKSAGLGDGGERSEAPEWLGKALLEGYPDQLAVRFSTGSSGFQLSDGRRGQAAETSIVKAAKVVVVGEVAEIEGREVRVVLNDLTEIEEEWLEELYPGEFSTRVEAVYDATSRRVRAREVKVFRDLVLESRERGEPDADEAGALLAKEVVAGNLVLKKWDHSVEQWIARVNCLAEWMPELELPRIGDDDREFLMAQVCAGAKGYKEIKDRSPWPVLKTWLSGPQRAALDSYAPERVEFSNGRSAKVAYGEGEAPKVGVILQQLYDVNENPTVAGGKVTVVVEVLAPNRRPAQVTGDLGAFWKSSYEGVKKELKGRYPKHEWR